MLQPEMLYAMKIIVGIGCTTAFVIFVSIVRWSRKVEKCASQRLEEKQKLNPDCLLNKVHCN